MRLFFVLCIVIGAITLGMLSFWPQITGFSEFSAIEESNGTRIGAILPLSGSGSRTGEAARNGMLLALEDLHSEVELLFEDWQNDGKTALRAMQKLRSGNRVQLFVTWLSASSNALSPVVESEKSVLLYGSAVDPPAEKYSFVFKNHTSVAADCKILAHLLQGKKGAGFMANHDSTHLCLAEFKATGFSFPVEFFQKGETDYRTSLSKLKAIHPEFLLIRTNTIETENILRQLREIDFGPVQIVCPTVGAVACDFEGVSEFSDVLQNAIGTDFYLGEENPKVKAFLERYRSRFGATAIADAVYGYEDVFILHQAASSCKDKEPFSVCVQNALLSQEFEGLDGKIRFDANGVIQRPSYVLHFDGNRWVK